MVKIKTAPKALETYI